VPREKSNALNLAGMQFGKKEDHDPINGIINGYFKSAVIRIKTPITVSIMAIVSLARLYFSKKRIVRINRD
jgi:hypothetical protein